MFKQEEDTQRGCENTGGEIVVVGLGYCLIAGNDKCDDDARIQVMVFPKQCLEEAVMGT